MVISKLLPSILCGATYPIKTEPLGEARIATGGCAPRPISLLLKLRATLMLKRQESGAVTPGIPADAPIEEGGAAQSVEPPAWRLQSLRLFSTPLPVTFIDSDQPILNK